MAQLDSYQLSELIAYDRIEPSGRETELLAILCSLVHNFGVEKKHELKPPAYFLHGDDYQHHG